MNGPRYMLVSDADRAALEAAARIVHDLSGGDDGDTAIFWHPERFKVNGDLLVDTLIELATRPAQASDRTVGPATASTLARPSPLDPAPFYALGAIGGGGGLAALGLAALGAVLRAWL